MSGKTSYRQAVPALLRLSEIDTQIGERHVGQTRVARTLDDLERRVGEMSGQLETDRQQLSFLSGVVSGDHAVQEVRRLQEQIIEGEHRYRTLQKEYRDQSGAARARSAVLEREVRLLEVRRRKMATETPHNILALYDAQVRGKALPAIAPADGGCCAGCGSALPSSLAEDDGHAADALRCPHCRRLLYFRRWLREA